MKSFCDGGVKAKQTTFFDAFNVRTFYLFISFTVSDFGSELMRSWQFVCIEFDAWAVFGTVHVIHLTGRKNRER